MYSPINFLWLLGFFCFMGMVSSASVSVELRFASELEALEGSGWHAQNVALQVVHNPGHEGALTIAVERLTIIGLPMDLEKVRLHCAAFSIDNGYWRCSTATVSLALGGKPLAGKLRFSYQPGDRSIDFAVSDLIIAEGRMNLTGEFSAAGWQATLQAANLKIAVLADWLKTLPDWPLAPGQNRGRVSFEAELAGVGETIATARLQLQSSRLSIATASGRYATQEFAFRFHGQWQGAGQFSGNLRLLAGQAYLEPVFLQLNASGPPVTVQVAGRLQKSLLLLDALRFDHPHVLQARASASIALGEENDLRKLSLDLDKAVFPTAYSVYIEPFLADMGLAGLHTDGEVRGRILVERDNLRELALELTALHLNDALDRFSVEGLNGNVVWSPARTTEPSKLSWDRGQLYRLDIGAAMLRFESHAGVLRLAGEAHIPVLDGALVITHMEAEGLGATPLDWRFDGLLTPISMHSLSRAFGWPLLAGKLSGMIPGVHYTEGVLQVGGSLLIRIFAGDIVITQLRIDDLLGPVPEAFADLDIRGLDLMTLTQTFDFGNIQGKLNGRIDDLKLVDWQPVEFDAVFATPKGDTSKRRISQQAVKNLSALSGANPSALLSRGFLSLFKTFRYKRLGIRCQLRQGVCEMGGVGSAGPGYYLVEGEGLPRIDIIGYNRRVDWQELLARLRAAIQSGDPVIE